MIITTSTPQPFSLMVKDKALTATEVQRNTLESELWDDNSDVIFASKSASLSFPVRVACRVWITAQADMAGAGTLTINVDSVAQTPTTVVADAVTGVCNTYIDLSPGNHSVTITSGVALSDHLILVRRGRKPPSI